MILDAKKKKPFKKPAVLEVRYARQLRQIAREVGRIVKAYNVGTQRAAQEIGAQLNKYADLLRPWAEVTAVRMAQELDQQDRGVWSRNARAISTSLRRELDAAPVGDELQRFLQDNVKLITSLPTEAAERVHRLTTQSLADSSRAAELKQEIMRTGEVTEGRALMIARTEIARTQSGLTQKRAEAIGSEAYIWRTVKDEDVRREHRKLEGRVIYWNNPPVAGSSGERAHAGQIYNCRCYPEPILPELD